MKKFLPLLFLVGACAPDIAQDPGPGPSVIAQFDPGNAAVAIVPAPNDLALITGKVVVPVPKGCPDLTDPANPVIVRAPNAPATSTNGVKDADETDVDCGGHSTNACDAGKACSVAEDCAGASCTAGVCVGGCPSAAQQEFNRRYLGGLSGFPFESTASCSFSAELDPASVTPLNVLIIDITNPAAPAPVFNLKPRYENKQIFVDPPEGGWTRGHHYAIVLRGGDGGLRGVGAEPVIGSETWTLVSSKSSLLTCEDLNAPDCKPTVDIIPSEEHDPAKRLAEQTALAKQLEQIRRGYDQILTGVEAAASLAREDVPLLWTFQIVDAGEVTFDPAKNIVPFPNDILIDPTTKKVALPNPKTFMPLTEADCASPADLQIALVCGLNTLDGFSTLAPPVSENSDAAGAVTQANVDPASLNPKSVGLVPVKAEFPSEQTAPKYTPCINCLSSKDASGNPQTSPQQLQWSLQAPLDERTQYLAYVTSEVKDDQGKNTVASPAFALLRLTQPLAIDGKSTVSLLTDAQASQLEPLRAAMKPALDGLEAAGAPRDAINLAFAFTTQSEASTLDQLRGLPTLAGAAGLPGDPVALADATTAYQTAAGGAGIDVSNVDKFFGGAILSPVLVTGPSGAFNPDPTKSAILPVRFVVATPKTAGPWPITIFGHGLNGWRNDVLPVVNALTGAGQMVIATDVLFHGDRTSCTGSASVTAASIPSGLSPSDDFACAAPAPAGGNMKCDGGTPLGLCVLSTGTRDACTPGPLGDAACAGAGQGSCAADSKCQGAGAGLALGPDNNPKVSGWNIFSLTNFFATRDNFRQQVIDQAQLVRVLKGTGFVGQLSTANIGAGGSAVTIDTTKMNFVGQSLGSILGTLFNAVSPDTNNVALNVGGGSLTTLFLESPTLAPQKDALLKILASQNIEPGSPAFDQFIATVQWILDPADPANMAYRLTHPADTGAGSAPNANRKVFLQFIEGDQFVINASNLALVAAANRSFTPTPPSFGCAAPLFCWEFTEAGATSNNPAGGSPPFDTTSAPLAKRHGFLRIPPTATEAGLAITAAAQKQVVTFISTGNGP